mmetsp:Transcript_35328/g.92390  ORF Transcript_35328/g.92390 Transcript_35328/m.92390 type:complete len:132 (+) Transcript_35328:231-626(+)|eukprot:CAMPEP_0182928526 /NCGR_PEP_ID=MMETSP0105_2-20130417/15632_1 /TAXON_ID=81532 ORGANISM="Acanthoeca-like sp., Strain 10tr" /NCGR_SAMPLE_ID=MMETSP0105_2 /ASSEMBLY_ACC=CAM_ASM_000205 /LENGTH=131 /DNA_ID=CAMNT_0025066531 /DNA_START=224 /DNA_END=619 /DNA_ORIENTATION=+
MSSIRELHTDAEFAVDQTFEKELSAREKKKLAMAMSLMSGAPANSIFAPPMVTHHTVEHTAKRRRKGKGGAKVPPTDVCVIEELLGRRMQNGTMMYLCRWHGLDAAHDTWEPAENIFCRALIDEFDSSLMS